MYVDRRERRPRCVGGLCMCVDGARFGKMRIAPLPQTVIVRLDCHPRSPGSNVMTRYDSFERCIKMSLDLEVQL